MKRVRLWLSAGLILVFVFLPMLLSAQGTLADYERAGKLRERFQGQVVNAPERATWIENTSRFWYRRSVKGGNEFMVIDAATKAQTPAFDHARLAASLSSASGEKYAALTLPFPVIAFVDQEKALEFTVGEFRWRCDLSDYSCKKVGPAERRGGGGPFGIGIWDRGPAPQAASPETKASPDGKWEAFIKNFNVGIRAKGQKDETILSRDGSEGDYYTFVSLSWSPDSKKLAAYRHRRSYHRTIQYVESSPSDQLQPKHWTMEYAKPGDVLDIDRPVLFLIDSKQQIIIDNALFSNPYDMSSGSPPWLVWWKDSRAFTFEYNQRGHQVYRVIEVDGVSGKPRALVSEEYPTFFCYSGKKYRADLQDGKEIVWMSERDGWNHLYLYDGVSGSVKNQITKGNWVVRGVDKVDEAARQVYFQASGMYPGKDPYFLHYYRINLDGSGLTALTDADANHVVALSSDKKYYVDTWSRVDLPHVSELRQTADKKVVMEVEKADIQGLVKAGWRAPEVFTSKARDGKTDIWGIIIRPTNFDAKKKYPVIENIYAGPQGSFVPKAFMAFNPMMSLAELGFIVVQVDGMGTSNRSKAFHDVCYKNLGDAGFPDRILWHKAIAAKYPYYDISRVGIYGTSAGGQNSTGGVLFHPEFYKVCVSACGCHDNRMDKLWWNEQWMGWPLDESYAASSNVDNAYRLQGKLFLIVGEMDTNVDPSSTMQVVNALIKANKTFDLLVIPDAGHGMGGAYGERKMDDFFVHNLLGVDPPNWNQIAAKK